MFIFEICTYSLSQELHDYFSELIQPLATIACLEQMFQKLKEEIAIKFEERFLEQNKKIDELEERVSYQENIINQLLIKCDDNEQYDRRNCLRIHGTESKKHEKIDDMWQKVKECYESIQVPFAQEDISRIHRIGMEYTQKNPEKEVKSIIVKFKSWRAQIQLYNARSKNFKDGKKKPLQIIFCLG